MQPIGSGTTTERIVRTAILAVVLVLYSGWSFKDGYRTYPHKNAEELAKTLAVPLASTPEINPQVTRTVLETVQTGDSAARVAELLGEPAARQGDTALYFGPAGMGEITFRADIVVRPKPRWRGGKKSEVDLLLQKVIGVVTGLLGLIMVAQLIRALSTRVELTDEGLRVTSQGGFRWGGSPLVPFDAMVGLKTDDFKKKGWVEVEYKLADGRQGTVSLNDYVHKAFPEVVNEICARSGFENPLTPSAENDQTAASAEQAPGGEQDSTPSAGTDQPGE